MRTSGDFKKKRKWWRADVGGVVSAGARDFLQGQGSVEEKFGGERSACGVGAFSKSPILDPKWSLEALRRRATQHFRAL